MNARIASLSTGCAILLASSAMACGGGGFSSNYPANVVASGQPVYHVQHSYHIQPVYQTHSFRAAVPSYPFADARHHTLTVQPRTISVPRHNTAKSQAANPRTVPAPVKTSTGTTSNRSVVRAPVAPQAMSTTVAKASVATELATQSQKSDSTSPRSLTSEETVALLKLFTAKEVKDALQ